MTRLNHKSRGATLAATAILGLSLAACSTTTPADGPTAPSAAPASPAPALSRQQASAVITEYSRVNNQANAHRNRQLLDTVEDGPLFAQSVAGYKADEGLPAKDQEKYQPWAYAPSAELFIPRFAPGQPRWFMAVARGASTTLTAQRLLVFTENTAAHRWEMVAAPDLNEQVSPIAVDREGFAIVGQPSATKGLELAAAVNDDFATGGQKAGRGLVASPAAKRQIDVHRTTGARLRPLGGDTRFAAAENPYPNTYTLKTADGGTLVVFASSHMQTDVVLRPGLAITPPKSAAAWIGTAPRPAMATTFTCVNVAAVPAAGTAARLEGYGCEVTNYSAGANF